ncbi:hypothetical protein L195_g012480 [Trifolium pratense]|uniref:Uncharacterized protein n=1 Tax=Trifolium pratense TaxID=57577 RepID=A0A2K3PKH7_TRIPR|nr:hypothetical protein L195_g012480 [Trifolium pratense]
MDPTRFNNGDEIQWVQCCQGTFVIWSLGIAWTEDVLDIGDSITKGIAWTADLLDTGDSIAL